MTLENAVCICVDEIKFGSKRLGAAVRAASAHDVIIKKNKVKYL